MTVEDLIKEARYEARFFAFNSGFPGGCSFGPKMCLQFAKLIWNLSEELSKTANIDKDQYWIDFSERLNKMSEDQAAMGEQGGETVGETIPLNLSPVPQDSEFPEGFPENVKSILKNCARVRSIRNYVKELSHQFDEAYSLDLNPHLTIEFVVSEVTKRVNAEGHCPETTSEEVMVMWLTDLHLAKGQNSLVEDPPKYLPKEDEPKEDESKEDE